MPSPLISCLEVKEELGKAVDCTHSSRLNLRQQQQLQREMTAHSYAESSVLKHLVQLPENLLLDHSARIAGYAPIRP
jgi:hypothetical protein